MRGREPSFPPRNLIRQPAHFLPTSGLPSSQQAPPSSLVSFPLPRQLRQKDRREARREGAKTTRGREARQCQTWWGEKDRVWIAAAVAGGELQKATGQGAANPRWKPGTSLLTPALQEGAWKLALNWKHAGSNISSQLPEEDASSVRTWTFFHPISAPQSPIPKAGRGRTNELLRAGEQTTEAPLRLPSVQTTCSGLRDCTVVCTLVRLCWDTPHTASAARGRQHLHGRGTCLERVVGCGNSCMQSSSIPQPGRITPFEAMLDHFYLPLHQPTHILLIPSPSFTPLLSASRTCPRGGCIQDCLCFT
nr:uncharacterized protein LOC125181186 [Anser cygnoides]